MIIHSWFPVISFFDCVEIVCKWNWRTWLKTKAQRWERCSSRVLRAFRGDSPYRCHGDRSSVASGSTVCQMIIGAVEEAQRGLPERIGGAFCASVHLDQDFAWYSAFFSHYWPTIGMLHRLIYKNLSGSQQTADCVFGLRLADGNAHKQKANHFKHFFLSEVRNGLLWSPSGQRWGDQEWTLTPKILVKYLNLFF